MVVGLTPFRTRVYRRGDSCHQCPNTAWLLFLMFSVGLLVLVGVSVYLSKKRLNLAALGIGVVRFPCMGRKESCDVSSE